MLNFNFDNSLLESKFPFGNNLNNFGDLPDNGNVLLNQFFSFILPYNFVNNKIYISFIKQSSYNNLSFTIEFENLVFLLKKVKQVYLN